MKKIAVWDLQTRIFHWSLVVFTLCALVTADFLRIFGIVLVNKDTWLAFHIGVGAAVGILLAFRIFWGLFGPHYSRFNSLHLSLRELIIYLNFVRKNIKTAYIGHNPAASWTVLCIIALGLLAVISGIVVFSLDEGRGILSPMYATFHPYADKLKLLHLGLSYAMLAVICGHIGGVLNETIRHKTGIITSMFTGTKLSDEPEPALSIRANLKIISLIWVIAPIFAVLYFSISTGTSQPTNLVIPDIYKKECAACHMAFSPNSLPAASWKKIMANLRDHFGDDASINDASKKEIEEFLVKNAAELSFEEASIKFIRSIDMNNPPQRITDIAYWKEKHQKIDPAIYQRASIKSRINCVACHKWSEYGSFEDSDIRIPKE
jgi:cytochrome b